MASSPRPAAPIRRKRPRTDSSTVSGSARLRARDLLAELLAAPASSGEYPCSPATPPAARDGRGGDGRKGVSS